MGMTGAPKPHEPLRVDGDGERAVIILVSEVFFSVFGRPLALIGEIYSWV